MRAIARTTMLLAGLAGAAALCPVPAIAQANSPIVVTGKQLGDKARVLETVRRVARPVDGQLARFNGPVCPEVIGFQQKFEEIVENRIRTVAQEIGARVDREGCIANLFVVIVDDGTQFIRELQRERPVALGGLSKRQIERLANDDGSARAWSSTVATNSDGAVGGIPAQGGREALASTSNGFGPNLANTSTARVVRVHEGSNISPALQQAIASSWVVIETGATFDLTLTQIADYAAMRGLAMVQPERLNEGDDTILGLFESEIEAAPSELTAFDRAYLKSLYRVQGRRWARQQVRQMAGAIAREAEQAEP